MLTSYCKWIMLLSLTASWQSKAQSARRRETQNMKTQKTRKTTREGRRKVELQEVIIMRSFRKFGVMLMVYSC